MSSGPTTDDRPEVRELLANLKRDHDTLAALLEAVSDDWVYEDLIYRFWHQSMKVFWIQETTVRLVDALKALAPGRPLNPWFEQIVAEGTGRTFTPMTTGGGSR